MHKGDTETGRPEHHVFAGETISRFIEIFHQSLLIPDTSYNKLG